MVKYLLGFLAILGGLFGSALAIFSVESFKTWMDFLFHYRTRELSTIIPVASDHDFFSNAVRFQLGLAGSLIVLLWLVYLLVLKIKDQPKKHTSTRSWMFFAALIFVFFTMSFNTFSPNNIICLIRTSFTKTESVQAKVIEKEYNYRGRRSLNGKYYLHIETDDFRKDRIPVASFFYEKTKVGDPVSAISCGIRSNDFFLIEDRLLWGVALSTLNYFIVWLTAAYLFFACAASFWILKKRSSPSDQVKMGAEMK